MSGPQAPGPGRIEVSVVVDGDHLASIDQVAAALEGAGLRVSEVMGGIGIITGTAADQEKVVGLQDLEGVEAVEVARSFQLPPPESDLQ